MLMGMIFILVTKMSIICLAESVSIGTAVLEESVSMGTAVPEGKTARPGETPWWRWQRRILCSRYRRGGECHGSSAAPPTTLGAPICERTPGIDG